MWGGVQKYALEAGFTSDSCVTELGTILWETLISTHITLCEIIKNYIDKREQLTNLFVLIDSRHEPQRIDTEFITWLGEMGIPFSIVFTKVDKLSRAACMRNVEAYKRHLLTEWESLPPIFITSSENKTGREELLAYIEEILS